MGTSKRYGGPSNGLVPSFVEDPPLPTFPDPSVPPVQPTPPDGQGTPSPQPQPTQRPELDPQPIPSRPDTSGAGELRGARSNFTRFSRTGSRSALGKALSNYVRTGTGGSQRAARRMGSSRVTAQRLLGVIRDFQRGGPVEALSQFNLSTFAGHSAADVFTAILEFVCPPGGSVDEAIARQAMMESIGDMAEAGIGSFDTLTPEQRQDFFLDFVAYSIEGRVMSDIGSRGIMLPDDIAAVENAQIQLHDFVTGATRGQLSGRLSSVGSLSDRDIETVVKQIYEIAFELVALAGEASI